MSKRFQYTTLIIISLVALRLGIGWQFFKEGAAKFQDPKPYSAGFLANAKGPLAPMFRGMVWDRDGLARLNGPATLETWTQSYHWAGSHFGFDEEQKKRAEQTYNRYSSKIRQFLADNAQDIREYQMDLERLQRDQRSPEMVQVASLSGQVTKREAEMRGKLGGWLNTIDGLWANYERDLNAIATEQQLKRGTLELGQPGRGFMDSVAIDGVVRWFDVLIGAFLILGLLTRFTSVVAALFLGAIVATQPPWAAGAAPVYYQVNLMLALFVLAATGAGRFAGLDFLLGRLRYWCCPPKQEQVR